MSDYSNHPILRASVVLLTICMMAMLWYYVQGYSSSMDWSVTTEPNFQETPAYQFQKGPFLFKILADKVTLTESFYGKSIKEMTTHRTGVFLLILLGIVLVITCASYFKQVGFLVFAGAVIFFIIQLELDFYLNKGKWILVVPIVLLVGPAYYFQAFQNRITFLLRFASIAVSVTIGLLCVPEDLVSFSHHFLAESILPFGIVIFIFLALISEEILFGFLFLLTKSQGGRNNHLHLLGLGGIYVANLLGYYLNRAGLLDFTFTFMNPFVLMILSTAVALWSLRHKEGLLGGGVHKVSAFLFVVGLGIISYGVLIWGFVQGIDVIPEVFHLLIIYTHLSFGFFFLAYIILNLIDPLSQGLQVYKIVYKPQIFHYTTARLAGLAFISAFFFLSSQLAYKLLKSARFSMMADIERLAGEDELALTYYKYAEFLGYRAHYQNYRMGTHFLERNELDKAKRYFDRASANRPSPQAFLNTSNLQSSSDLGLSKVKIDLGLLAFGNQPELLNNLGVINWKNRLYQQAYEAFNQTSSEQHWNRALMANKYGVMADMKTLKNENFLEDFNEDNLSVKINVLSALLANNRSPNLTYDSAWVSESPYPLLRQAMLLNSSLLFFDSVLTRQISHELNSTYPDFKDQLVKARAINQYRSGNVKAALENYDLMYRGLSGLKAGEVLNEMGLIALDQNAPREARDFFGQAIENGFDARFNRLVAFLEYQDYSNAILQLEELVVSDSSYTSLRSALSNVFEPGSDSTVQSRFNELYYNLSDKLPADIQMTLKSFDSSTKKIILQKIEALVDNEVFVFDDFEDFDIKKTDFSDISNTELVSKAWQNPFHEKLILLASEKLSESDPIEAYTLLSESLKFNPYSIPLLKAKVMLSVDINLPEYVHKDLITLSNLLLPEAYSVFEVAWYRKRNAKQEEDQLYIP